LRKLRLSPRSFHWNSSDILNIIIFGVTKMALKSKATEQKAMAGRDAKGDCLIEIIPKDSGGLIIELQSSVKAMFGTHIERLIELASAHLRIENAVVCIKDNGSLDHVILARIEAAARQLWDIPEPGILPDKKVKASGTQKDRLRRTRLYLPGNNPDLMLNAGLYGADCIILDLEDSVAPDDKDAARILVRNTLLTVDFGNSERIVRINPLNSDYGAKDLEMIVPALPDTLLVPKCESKEDISAVEEMLIFYEQQEKIEHEIMLMPLLETAKGILNAQEIATSSDRIVALCFGAEDFTADIGAQRTTEGRESFVARSLIVLAAKAAGVQAIDTVFSDVEDMEGLFESAREAKGLGFDGKGVIHPGQIKPIHEAFAPTEDEIEHANRVMQAIQEAKAKGSGVAALGSKMIDAPVVARARKVLAMAEAINTLSNHSPKLDKPESNR